jgi:dihydrofolate synthase/folylpolyglutamate synthase
MTDTQVREADKLIEKLMQLHPKGFDLSLERITKLLEKLGNPQDKMPPIIHVAGTNGKGSVTAFARALLEASGRSVHVHTSPHLVNWNERYRIGKAGGKGQLVDDAAFADALSRVAAANDGQMITVFEILTAVTFILFSEHLADAAIIEVGLGGRFDATNVISSPAVSVVMPVSLDHEAYLGDTVEKIAFEKAGIIKPRCPVVIGNQPFDGALEVISRQAEKLRCPLSIYGQDFSAHSENGRLVYQDDGSLVDCALPRLIGVHQPANAAAAIRAVKAAGFALSDDEIDLAMREVSWPGRMQKITHGRIFDLAPQGSEIWIDGGHNPGAGLVISETFKQAGDQRPLIMIAGMINTKDSSGYFKAFDGMIAEGFTVPISGSDASVDVESLAQSARSVGLTFTATGSIAEALERVKEAAQQFDVPPRILIGGSLYLAGNALAFNGTIPE